MIIIDKAILRGSQLYKELCLALLQEKHGAPEVAISNIMKYLQWRQSTYVKGDDSFGVVFITSRYCNLTCKHCAVDTQLRESSLTDSDTELSTQEVIAIILKLRKYADQAGQKIFFMFGGGEPTLRDDFPLLLREAASVFGKNSVGFCTNGTFLCPDKIMGLADCAELVEISLDGFQDYHNYWRPPTNCVPNPYMSTMSLVYEAIKYIPNKLEVASMVTNSNMHLLPDFARLLRDKGVKNYSIHRPVPIGRMFHHHSSIPNAHEFLSFFASMAKVALEDSGFSLHLHHSLESIFSALLLGKDIHLSDVPLGSRRHSIGLDSDGSVHFDPWAILPPFSLLSPGTLKNERIAIEDILGDHRSALNLIIEAKKANVRCYQCSNSCSGGMRLAAIIESLMKEEWPDSIMPSEFIAAISAIDPACPLSMK